jgi:hypothetical protein
VWREALPLDSETAATDLHNEPIVLKLTIPADDFLSARAVLRLDLIVLSIVVAVLIVEGFQRDVEAASPVRHRPPCRRAKR